MQFLCIARSRNSPDMVLKSADGRWLIGRYFVQKDTCHYYMTVCIKSYMTIMYCKQTKLRFVSQKKTERKDRNITCGSIEPEKCNKPIVLYDYQPTRNTSHPRKFLKDFKGVCVTDGYQVYHTLEEERDDLTVAGCWAHARRRFDEAVKALPKAKRNESLHI